MIYLHGLKWIGVSLIFLTALAFAGFGVLLALPQHQEPGKTLWVAGIVMGLIGATLGWLGSRAARRRVLPFRGDGAQSNSVHDSLGRLLWDEAVTEGSMQLAELAALYQNVSSSSPVALKEGFDAGLDAALQKAPRNPMLLVLRALAWMQTGKYKEAVDFADHALQISGTDTIARFYILAEKIRARVMLNEPEIARRETDEFLSVCSSKEAKVALLDTLACLPLMQGAKEFLPEAVTYAKRALEIDPDDLTLQGTYGSLLFDQGHTQEGADILRSVYERSHSEADRGISALYLALFAKQKGNLRQAGSFAKEATTLHPQPWLIQRVKTAFGEDAPTLKCYGCGVEASAGVSLTAEHIPFRHTRRYCPNCHREFVLRVLKFVYLLQPAIGVVGIALLLAKSPGACVYLNIFLMQCFTVVCIFPHELAHAWAAKFCKWRVHRIYIGYGKSLLTRRFLGFDWDFRAVVLGGLVHFVPDMTRYKRWKHFVVIAAGPAMNGLLLAIAYGFFASQQLWSFSQFENQLIPIQMFCVANVSMLVGNLIPFEMQTPDGKIGSDGQQLLQILFGKPHITFPTSGTKNTGNTNAIVGGRP